MLCLDPTTSSSYLCSASYFRMRFDLLEATQASSAMHPPPTKDVAHRTAGGLSSAVKAVWLRLTELRREGLIDLDSRGPSFPSLVKCS